MLPRQTLKELFEELVDRSFEETLKISDSEITAYVSDLLTQFS